MNLNSALLTTLGEVWFHVPAVIRLFYEGFSERNRLGVSSGLTTRYDM
jgi:hypothetical protein